MRIAGSLLALLAASAPALGGLGDDATPAAPGQPGAGRVLRALPVRNYTVQEIRANDGATIREYVSPAGKVFGVVWSGSRMPNLRQLFGNHFDAFQDEQRARQPRRGPLKIERPDLVIQSGGHPRAFRGRAFLPDRLPPGVSADEIR